MFCNFKSLVGFFRYINIISKFYLKSLFIKDIFRFGRVFDSKVKKFLIFKFEFVYLEWLIVLIQVEFVIEEKEFVVGGF